MSELDPSRRYCNVRSLVRYRPYGGRVTAESKAPVEISNESREGPQGPHHAEESAYPADPKRTDDGASESPARGRCPHRGLRWGRRNTTSRKAGFPTIDMRAQAVPPTTMAPKDGECLSSPFGGNADMGEREGHIIAGTCRGKRE